MRVVALVPVLACALAGPLSAQVPDTLPPPRADTLGGPPRPVRDSTLVADSVSADTIFYNLPEIDRGPAGGWMGGVWTWNHEEILATGSLTLVDLLETVPGMVALRSGDFGTPIAVTAFGLGGDRIRVFRDGFEVVPLGGGSLDLAQVGLAGVVEVRLERLPGEIRVALTSYRFDDGRAYSLIEAGTGDLNTNIFRGSFANPTALGGDIALGLERLDSRGARGNEPGFNQGTWLRYQLHRGDAAGIGVDFRRMATETEADVFANKVTRSDLVVRASVRLLEGLTAQAYWGRSSRDVEDDRDAFATEGGRRSQLGLRAGYTRAGVFADAAYRRFGNEALPQSDLELSLGVEREEIGGVAARIERASWDAGDASTSTSATSVRGWTRPLLGFSAFGSWASGTYGARIGPVADVVPPVTEEEDPPADGEEEPAPDEDEPVPLFRVTDRTTTRYGAQWAWRGVALSGARLRLEADSLLPIGFEPDRSQPALAGGTRTGWEAWGRIPVPVMPGLRVEGSLQQWDESWSYMPERIYRGAFTYHRTFLDTENFELWWSIGVIGHDPMDVRQVVGDATDEEGEPTGPELGTVPFYQNWYARLQIRIVTVRVFLGWDNFTVRRNLQDIPDRLLPQTRAFYGIRWTMWN